MNSQERDLQSNESDRKSTLQPTKASCAVCGDQLPNGTAHTKDDCISVMGREIASLRRRLAGKDERPPYWLGHDITCEVAQ